MTQSRRLAKWQLVVGTVVRHASFGLLIRVSTGEQGVVDAALISDLPVYPSEWPAVGEEILLVSGGYTSGLTWRPEGQLRLSARESDLEMARARQAHPERFNP